MENPFVFGKIISGDHFLDREKEQQRLQRNILSGINSMLVSPRRWGKSSLVRQVAERIQQDDSSVRFCFIDMFNIRKEEDFYSRFVTAILKTGSERWEKWMEDAKLFLTGLIPKFSMGSDPMNDFSVSLDWKEVKKNPEEILSLPEIISIKKKIRIVVCIDEFQNLGFFNEPLVFQKILRANWQLHKNAVYILLGSRRHMLTDLFNNPSMPFYRFGDLVMLEKIPAGFWPLFISERFTRSGKKFPETLAANIPALLENHPYYIQYLTHEIWGNIENEVTEKTVENAISNLLDQNNYLFQMQTDNLPNTQVAFLRALSDGVASFTSMETMKKYDLGSVSNIRRIREALIQKEIIDISPGKLEFLDPLYKLWFTKNFMT
ncbi:MAG: ATP-binding protein [Bacteroidetes bacterium]|nr:ATP-binding protein [Bacteroidota bacterium]